MTSSGPGGSLPPNFLLTPQQQSLLFAALNSNKPQTSISPPDNSMSPNSLSSPMQSVDAAGSGSGYRESPYLDNYDYDFGDSSFDFSFANGEQAKMIGDVPGVPGSTHSDSTEGESNDKRAHPDDEDDDESPGNDSKRRESSDKIHKKPGRKPLTSEPTSKRKAQNRAAQRAFRERKEKHLKDLETKVEELEKASEVTTHENSKLRAQVERMTAELKQYKQKITVLGNTKSIPREKVPFGSAAVNNLSDVNFQFEFPKFGMLPGPPAKQQPQRSTSQPLSPVSQAQNTQASSPARSQTNDGRSPQQSRQTLSDAQFKDELAKFSNIFTPSMASSTANGSRASLDSASIGMGASSSPSASSHSAGGPSSSCGTSPEPFTQSPLGFKPVDAMATIGEEQQPALPAEPGFAQFATMDYGNTNFDWLAQQNGGQFDPQLFGGYREPQENILANPTFDDFFNDALDADFFTPYNTAASPNLAKKGNLIDEIDAKKNDDEYPNKDPNNMNCTQIWEKLQSCPKAQSGEFDLDGLCSELTKKAKCSGSGPVVGETDFDSILNKYMGKEVTADCMADKLGISIDRTARPNGVTLQ